MTLFEYLAASATVNLGMPLDHPALAGLLLLGALNPGLDADWMARSWR